MADDLTAPGPPPVLEETPLARPLAFGQQQSFGGRFRTVYVGLALVLAGTAAGFYLLVSAPSGSSGGRSWSAWRPTASGDAGQQQIADHVASRYRLTDGKQLVAVLATPPQVQGITIRAIAIQTGSGTSSSDIKILPADGGVMYALCGLGQNCAIPEGTPSLDRARLLRREALELALYTFEYESSVRSVIAFLPPKPGSQPTYLLFFARNDLSAELRQPLVQTLAPTTKLVEGEKASAEGGVVDRLTAPYLYQFSFKQTQAGDPVIVLTPVVA